MSSVEYALGLGLGWFLTSELTNGRFLHIFKFQEILLKFGAKFKSPGVPGRAAGSASARRQVAAHPEFAVAVVVFKRGRLASHRPGRHPRAANGGIRATFESGDYRSNPLWTWQFF